MTTIHNQTFDAERALYGASNLLVDNCRFDGPADGESAFKEANHIEAGNCFFNLRYPFWHTDVLKIRDCEMTSLCRAALWYSSDITIEQTKLHGIKALRECARVNLSDCSIISPEFGWFSQDVCVKNTTAEGEYLFLRSRNLRFDGLKMKGKYSFQYIENAIFENCELDTKDAFWHAKHVTVRNCTVKGEYLAWYCEDVRFENCTIIGTQPLCYCKGLVLENCVMIDADLCFEKSEVQAALVAPILSIKNPKSGFITVPSVGEIIRDNPESKAEILIKN
jgi:hypothetical protein